MSVMPGVVWRGNCINNDGPRSKTTRGVILHVNDGQNVSLWSWVNSPTSNMSCHFQVLQDGTIEQYLDTDLQSWCQMAGNPEWISVEMPTIPGTPMTAAQVAAGARILAFCAHLYGFPLQLTDDPINGEGLGWHGMGGAAWGGHTGCPGDIRKAQRQDILTQAQGSDDVTPEQIATIVSEVNAHTDAKIAALGVLLVTDSTHNAHNALATRLDNALQALNDPKHGLVVAVAAARADIAAVKAELLTGGTPIDPHADAEATVALIAQKLGA